MPPNEYSPQTGPTHDSPAQPANDPFAFLNESHKPNPFRNLLSPSSFKSRLLIVLIGLLVLVLLFVGFKALLSSGSKVDLPSLYALASQQQELTNLASTGSQQSTSQSYLNFSFTSMGTTASDQAKLTNLLKINGIKLNSKNFTLQPSADAKLAQATQDSNFDPVYKQVMQQQLNYYLSDLAQAYNLNKSSVVKSYLSKDYQNTQLLIKMLGSASG